MFNYTCKGAALYQSHSCSPCHPVSLAVHLKIPCVLSYPSKAYANMYYLTLHIQKVTLKKVHLNSGNGTRNQFSKSDKLKLGLDARKPVFGGFANNTYADQPAHARSLISAFVIRFLESIICKLAAGEISIF